MVLAKVQIPNGADFQSEITDLTGSSVFLKTEQSVPFRSRVKLELFGLSLEGEVVYVSENEPKGVGLALEASSTQASTLEAEAKKLVPSSPPNQMDSPDPVPAPSETQPGASATLPAVSSDIFSAALRMGQARPSGPVSAPASGLVGSAFAEALRQGSSQTPAQSPLVTEKASASSAMSEGMRALVAQMEKSMEVPSSQAKPLSLDTNGRLQLEEPLVTSGIMVSLLAGLPVYIRAPSPVTEATLICVEEELNCRVQAVDSSSGILFSSDLDTLRRICKKLAPRIEDAIEESLESEHEPTVEEIPNLSANSNQVRFQSFKHFVVQYIANISKGAIIVSGAPLEPGLKKELSLFIPGISEQVQVHGRVSFQGEGSIGFMLEDFGAVQGKLAEIAARPPPSRQEQKAMAQSGSTQRAAIGNLSYRGFLSEKSSLSEIFSFQENRPADLKSCKGWLARILDFLFAQRVHGVCTFSTDERTIQLWVHDGGVVFTSVTPNDEQDKLGRMLVLQKKTSRTALQSGLEKAKENGQPIGRTLVSSGEIDSGTLNSAVRYQTMKRIFEAREWSKGKIEVTPWVDPPIRTGLVITSGNSIMVNLIREEVRRETLGDIEEFAEPYLDRVFEVNLSKQDASLGLKKKERRFFEKAAGSPVNLRDLPKATAVTVNEAYRYAILGKALGLMKVGQSALKKTAAEKTAETVSGLKDKIALMSNGDLFEVLGLHWTCVDREIEPAFKAKKREMSSFKDSSETQLRLLGTKGVELIEAAFETLSKPGKRKTYRDSVVSEEERKQAGANMLDQVQLLLVKDDVVQAQILLKTAQEIFRTTKGERLYSDIRDGSYKVDL